MDTGDRLLLTLARQRFDESWQMAARSLATSRALDWQRVYATAEVHGIAPLVYTNLLQLAENEIHIPGDVLERFKTTAYNNSIRKERRYRKLDTALEDFERRQLDVLLIKGAALDALVYEQPWFTVSLDIDVILRSRFSAPANLQRQLRSALHHTGIEFELFEHHDVSLNGALRIDFESIWSNVRRVTFRGHPVFVMSAEDHLISLCINSCRKRYFRLKSLCDIAESIQRSPELEWETLLERAQRHDCAAIVFTALYITDQTLRLPIPPVWEQLGVSPIRAAVLKKLGEWMLRRYSFSKLYPFRGWTFRQRKLHPSILLTYASYQPHQIRAKLQRIF